MIRLRGIYSTALAGLLDNAGYTFSDVTEQIKSRIPWLRFSRNGTLVTVKDMEHHKGLIVVGEHGLAMQVYSLIKAYFRGALAVVIEHGPFTLYRVRVIEQAGGGYLVELPYGVRGFLRSRRGHRTGDLVTAHVVKPSPSSPLLEEGVAVSGRYVRVIEGSHHSLSEHIRDPELALELLSLASRTAPEGWGVRFRSAAKDAGVLAVAEELERLVEEARRLKAAVEEIQEPRLVREGEAIAFVYFEPEDTFAADSLRNAVLRTARGHHIVKSLGDEALSRAIDEVEARGSSEDAFVLYLESLLSLISRGQVKVVHEKPASRGFTWYAAVRVRGDGFLQLERRIQSEGFYDGLGVKKETGDLVVTLTFPFSRFLVHQYFSASEKLKGIYVNLNTPLDATLSPPSLWYLDVHVDVVWTPESGARGVVDLEVFEELRRLDRFPNARLEMYRVAAERLARILSEGSERLLSSPALLLDVQREIWGGVTEKYAGLVLDKLREVSGGGRTVGTVADEVH
ncbi:DUF402 domain-containing protein [Infirmifilum sp. NZ]|uniref:DUF402 domain-containing protein n=1 Tax=Infirmifilum sp. NZ TaxID=2926850 RepID=UPI0027A3F2EC|nr:DUF402 domain-containing protein [Infirmifilum sp. NZ]UNQ72575.1 DUF402 domain-containing protein [Infirmifilum sp. NZ]